MSDIKGRYPLSSAEGQPIPLVERLNIPEPNMGDLKQWVVNQIRSVVLDEERAAAIRAVQQSHIDAPFDPS